MAIEDFIPELWSDTVLEAFYSALTYARPDVSNRDYEGEIQAKGNVVKIPSVASVVVDEYNGPWANWNTLDGTEQDLVIEKAENFQFLVDDIQRLQSAVNFAPKAAKYAGLAMAWSMERYIADKVGATIANGGGGVNLGAINQPSDVTTDWLYGMFQDAGARFFRAASQGRPVALVTPEVYALMQLSGRLKVIANDQVAGSVFGGQLQEFAGWKIIPSNATPVTKTTTVNGVATTTDLRSVDGRGTAFDPTNTVHDVHFVVPDATSVAEQLTKVEADRLPNGFADIVKGLHLYGAKVTRPELTGVAKITLTGTIQAAADADSVNGE